MPFCHDWLGRSLGGWVFDVELSTTAWAAQHLWWQYRYTGDLNLLRDDIYPFLREVAEFYAHVLVKDAAGQYNFELSHSPEQTWYCGPGLGRQEVVVGRNPALDIALVPRAIPGSPRGGGSSCIATSRSWRTAGRLSTICRRCRSATVCSSIWRPVSFSRAMLRVIFPYRIAIPAAWRLFPWRNHRLAL